METQQVLKTTPLLPEHRSLGAKMAPFLGWSMPIQYQGIIAETLWTRQGASCFDVCHMGEFLIKGDAERSNLDRILTANIKDLKVGSCRYSSMLNKNGCVIDDVILYRKAKEEWMVVVNAGSIDRDKRHFCENLSGDHGFTDLCERLGKIDLQGPLSKDILCSIAPAISKLRYYAFVETDILGEKNIISRTGYTGELGFEIYACRDKIRSVWKMLLEDKRVRPAGLGARDILRLEMGYTLYGQDVDEKTTPLEAGLDKFVDFNKDFIGKDALLEQKKSGLRRHRLFAKTLSRRSPRHNHTVYHKDKEIGTITSGTFSPHLQQGIGMGFVKDVRLGKECKIQIGDERLKIEAVKAEKPFIKRRH